jgi:hypothetical protein
MLAFDSHLAQLIPHPEYITCLRYIQHVPPSGVVSTHRGVARDLLVAIREGDKTDMVFLSLKDISAARFTEKIKLKSLNSAENNLDIPIFFECVKELRNAIGISSMRENLSDENSIFNSN